MSCESGRTVGRERHEREEPTMERVSSESAATLARLHEDERGLNTAELLGNAALAIVALLAIWGALQALGVDIVGWIGDQLGV